MVSSPRCRRCLPSRPEAVVHLRGPRPGRHLGPRRNLRPRQVRPDHRSPRRVRGPFRPRGSPRHRPDPRRLPLKCRSLQRSLDASGNLAAIVAARTFHPTTYPCELRAVTVANGTRPFALLAQAVDPAPSPPDPCTVHRRSRSGSSRTSLNGELKGRCERLRPLRRQRRRPSSLLAVPFSSLVQVRKRCQYFHEQPQKQRVEPLQGSGEHERRHRRESA